jgi:hypothetical protein
VVQTRFYGFLGRTRCVSADAAADFSALADVESRRTREARVATLADVVSLRGFLVML